MKIHAINVCGSRDASLMELMKHTLVKYCNRLGSFRTVNLDAKGYGNGAGFEASMMKLDLLREAAQEMEKDDWLLSIDSDVLFCNYWLFEWLYIVDGFKHVKPTIIGIQQDTDRAKTEMGLLNNMSGCSIYMHAKIVKKLAALGQEELTEVREKFKAWVLCENEDIILSYLAQMVGAKPLPIPDHFYNGDLHQDIAYGKERRSFYHLNYAPTYFLGQPVAGKWEIPGVLKKLNIEL